MFSVENPKDAEKKSFTCTEGYKPQNDQQVRFIEYHFPEISIVN